MVGEIAAAIGNEREIGNVGENRESNAEQRDRQDRENEPDIGEAVRIGACEIEPHKSGEGHVQPRRP